MPAGRYLRGYILRSEDGQPARECVRIRYTSEFELLGGNRDSAGAPLGDAAACLSKGPGQTVIGVIAFASGGSAEVAKGRSNSLFCRSVERWTFGIPLLLHRK